MSGGVGGVGGVVPAPGGPAAVCPQSPPPGGPLRPHRAQREAAREGPPAAHCLGPPG